MLVISLHAFLPHLHAAKGSVALSAIETPCPNAGLLQFLEGVLQLDLGKGHLEHLTPGEADSALDSDLSPAPTPLPAAIAVLALFPEPTIAAVREKLIRRPATDLPPDDDQSTPPDLRGPPVLA